MTAPPPRDVQTTGGGIPRPRWVDGSAFAVALLILLGLFGHLLNQQRASKEANNSVASAPAAATSDTKTEAPQQSASPPPRAATNTEPAKRSQVVNGVTQ